MVNKKIILLLLCIVPMYILGALDQIQELPEEQAIAESALVYLPPQLQAEFLVLKEALTEHEWSLAFKSLCQDIENLGNIATYESIMRVVDECVDSIALYESDALLNSIKSDIQEYKKELILGDLCVSPRDIDANEEDHKGTKRIFSLCVRFLEVTNSLTVNGNETVNGILSVNGALVVNGAVPAAGTVISVAGGTGITITGNPASNPTVNMIVPVSIANGGTNATSMANVNGVAYYDGTLLNTLLVGTAGQILTSRGPGLSPLFVTGSGGAGIASINGNSGSISGSIVTIQGGNNISTSGDDIATMTVDVSGTTDHAVQIGNSTGSLNSVAVGVSNTVLLGNTGADPSFGTVPNAALTNSLITLASGTGISVSGSPVALGSSATINLSTPVSIASGGTNATSMTNADGVVYYDGTKLNTTTVGTSGQLLTSNGTGSSPTFQAFTITNDSGSVSGHSLTLDATIGSGSTVQFSGSGSVMSLIMSDSNSNTAVGEGAGRTTMGSVNTLFGESAAPVLSGTMGNCALGQAALLLLRSGNYNCAFGQGVLQSLSSGSSNIAIGQLAGSNLTSNESNNIYLAAVGVAGENSVLRINQDLSAAYIGGIVGVTVSGAPVLVSSVGQLGVASSSRNYKNNIKDLVSSNVLDLRPITFNYKESELADETHYGLIAEEVAEVIPDLVIYDKSREPQTIKYHELPVLLLVQIKLLSAEIEKLKDKVALLEARR